MGSVLWSFGFMTLCNLVDRHIAEEPAASISLKKEAVYSSNRLESPAIVHGVITQVTIKMNHHCHDDLKSYIRQILIKIDTRTVQLQATEKLHCA